MPTAVKKLSHQKKKFSQHLKNYCYDKKTLTTKQKIILTMKRNENFGLRRKVENCSQTVLLSRWNKKTILFYYFSFS